MRTIIPWWWERRTYYKKTQTQEKGNGILSTARVPLVTSSVFCLSPAWQVLASLPMTPMLSFSEDKNESIQVLLFTDDLSGSQFKLWNQSMIWYWFIGRGHTSESILKTARVKLWYDKRDNLLGFHQHRQSFTHYHKITMIITFILTSFSWSKTSF